MTAVEQCRSSNHSNLFLLLDILRLTASRASVGYDLIKSADRHVVSDNPEREHFSVSVGRAWCGVGTRTGAWGA